MANLEIIDKILKDSKIVGVVYVGQVHNTAQRYFSVPAEALRALGIAVDGHGRFVHLVVETEPGRIVFDGDAELVSGNEINIKEQRNLIQPGQRIKVVVSRPE